MDFSSRDPAAAAFWDERYAAGFTPWDQGGVPPALLRALAARPPWQARVLVPGCGSGHEIAALAAAGAQVVGIDISVAGLQQAARVLPPELAQAALREADFFTLAESPFDWIYERAFLVALPPARWADWARRVAQLLPAGGMLAGLFVIEPVLPAPRRGPPFVTTLAELHDLLDTAFDLREDLPIDAAESLPVFAGRERWLRWQRR
jgi:SAM-dependent methyltransferase